MAHSQTVMAMIRLVRPPFRNKHDKVAFAIHGSFIASVTSSLPPEDLPSPTTLSLRLLLRMMLESTGGTNLTESTRLSYVNLLKKGS